MWTHFTRAGRNSKARRAICRALTVGNRSPVATTFDVMLTDSPPRKANLPAFANSDRINTLDLPLDRDLLTITKSLEWAMKGGPTSDVRCVSSDFLRAASKFYEVHQCGIQFLRLDRYEFASTRR